MTRETHSRAVVVLAVAAVVAVTVGLVAGPAVAQGYYNNSSASTPAENQSEWLDGRSGDEVGGVADLITEVADWVIGDTDAGGVQPLLVGVMLLGVFLGTMSRGHIGSVAGAAVAMGALATLALVTIIPMWLYAIALLGIGLALTAVVIRAFR